VGVSDVVCLVLWIQIRHNFVMDPDLDPDPDPSVNKQKKVRKTLIFIIL
jgi:hypothetical protein